MARTVGTGKDRKEILSSLERLSSAAALRTLMERLFECAGRVLLVSDVDLSARPGREASGSRSGWWEGASAGRKRRRKVSVMGAEAGTGNGSVVVCCDDRMVVGSINVVDGERVERVVLVEGVRKVPLRD